MSAVGLYGPINQLVVSISTVLVGDSTILCGKYIGQNRQNSVQNVFSLNMLVSIAVGVIFTTFCLLLGVFDLTGLLVSDAKVRPLFNQYLIGQAIGILPLMLSNSFAAFLSLENKGRRTVIASISYIIANILLNFLFVYVFQLQAFGLALASSLGM